jgi:hypothetical protein
MIAIDRLNYILSRINSKTLEAEIRVGCAIDALGLARGLHRRTNEELAGRAPWDQHIRD